MKSYDPVQAIALPPLPHAEQRELVRKWQEDQDYAARDLLVRSNMRLVVKFLRETPWVDAEDALQNSAIELCYAADHYKLDSPASFASYARWRLRKAMQDTAAQDRTVHIPYNVVKSRLKRRKVIDALIKRGMAESEAHSTVIEKDPDHFSTQQDWDTVAERLEAPEPSPEPGDVTPLINLIKNREARMVVRLAIGCWQIKWRYAEIARATSCSRQHIAKIGSVALHQMKRGVSR